jgi:hypothetical protein
VKRSSPNRIEAVNGLLQTEAYARELIAYHASITLGVNVEESMALRRPGGPATPLATATRSGQG